MDQSNQLLTLLEKRIVKVTNLVKERDADAIIIFSQPNYRYLTNFTGEEAELILTSSGERYLLSDLRFSDQIKAQAPGELNVIMKTKPEVASLKAVLDKLALKNVLIEGDAVSAISYQELCQACPTIHFELAEQLVERVRNVKDELELRALKRAIEISMTSFKQLLDQIKPGVKERDLAAKLDYSFKINGGDGPSFDTIIASGYRSSWAHGVASDKKIGHGELVVIDFGSFYHGYTADITRTIAVGEVSPELQKIYRIVHEAQRRGIEAATVGHKGADVDRAARQYISEMGYGQYFGHGIGHGIGLEIHELCMPALPFRSMSLKNDMVTTVEPGIYLPGKGGVRIEDDILIHDQDPITLSNLPKDDLLVL